MLRQFEVLLGTGLSFSMNNENRYENKYDLNADEKKIIKLLLLRSIFNNQDGLQYCYTLLE